MKADKTILLILFILASGSCVDPFELRSVSSEDFLVVEGLFSDLQRSHEIRLSRSAAIDARDFEVEEGANVTIEDQSGLTISLTETEPGIYVTDPFIRGTIGNSYQLVIETADGRSYRSDPVVMRSTPPIESVDMAFNLESIDDIPGRTFRIILNTSDPSGQTNFYRWEWEETFEIQMPLISRFEWIGGDEVIDRFIPTDRCWASDSSKNILIKSTEGLGQDVVQDQVLHSFRSFTSAMRVRYSILVRQTSLSEEGYQFWSQLRTFNENQGGLFDLQPAPVIGNIRSLDDENEIVLGYFDAAQVRETRRFFTPLDYALEGFTPSVLELRCELDTVPIADVGPFLEERLQRTTPFEIVNITGSSYITAPRFCTDCTNSGTNIRPDFWRE